MSKCKLKKILLFLSFALTNNAYAEENSSYKQKENLDNSYFNLPSIEVKGYGFIQKFKDISGSVSLFTKEDIINTHSVNLNELVNKAAGLQSFDLALVDFLVIRGTASVYDLKGKSHSVFLNGIPLPALEAQNIFLTDNISSVEVLKGPQHVLYGSKARSGAINIYMDRPHENQAELSVGFGNLKGRNIGLNTNLHLNKALDIGFLINKDYEGGFINNTTLNVKKGGHDSLLYNFDVYFRPTDKTLFNVFYMRNNVYKKPGFIMFDNEQNPVLYSISNFDDVHPSTILVGPRLNFHEERTDYGGEDHRDTRAFAFRIEHEFNDNIRLISILSQSHFNQYSLLDIDMNDIPWISKIGALNVIDDYRATSKYNDLKITGDYEKVKWIAGISKTEDENRRLASGQPFNTKIRAMRLGDVVKGKAAYIKLKLIPTKYFDFDLGFRRQLDKATPQYFPISDNNKINKIIDTFSNFIQKTLKIKPLPDHVNSSANLWTATATYHLNDNTNFYTTASKGYVSGSYTSFVTNSMIREEHGTAKEIGFKSQLFNDRLFLIGAAFDNKYKDYQFFNFLRYSMENIPNFRSKGYELSAYFIATPNIIFGATYSKVNPKIKNYKMRDLFGLSDSGLYDNFSSLTTFNNQSIPWVPVKNAIFNLILNKRIKSVDVIWNNSLSLKGKTYIDFGNKLFFKDVKIFDSTMVFKKGKNEFILWGKNLTNKKYFVNGFSAGLNVGVYGKGRTYGIGYKTKF